MEVENMQQQQQQPRQPQQLPSLRDQFVLALMGSPEIAADFADKEPLMQQFVDIVVKELALSMHNIWGGEQEAFVSFVRSALDAENGNASTWRDEYVDQLGAASPEAVFDIFVEHVNAMGKAMEKYQREKPNTVRNLANGAYTDQKRRRLDAIMTGNGVEFGVDNYFLQNVALLGPRTLRSEAPPAAAEDGEAQPMQVDDGGNGGNGAYDPAMQEIMEALGAGSDDEGPVPEVDNPQAAASGSGNAPSAVPARKTGRGLTGGARTAAVTQPTTTHALIDRKQLAVILLSKVVRARTTSGPSIANKYLDIQDNPAAQEMLGLMLHSIGGVVLKYGLNTQVDMDDSTWVRMNADELRPKVGLRIAERTQSALRALVKTRAISAGPNVDTFTLSAAELANTEFINEFGVPIFVKMTGQDEVVRHVQLLVQFDETVLCVLREEPLPPEEQRLVWEGDEIGRLVAQAMATPERTISKKDLQRANVWQQLPLLKYIKLKDDDRYLSVVPTADGGAVVSAIPVKELDVPDKVTQKRRLKDFSHARLEKMMREKVRASPDSPPARIELAIADLNKEEIKLARTVQRHIAVPRKVTGEETQLYYQMEKYGGGTGEGEEGGEDDDDDGGGGGAEEEPPLIWNKISKDVFDRLAKDLEIKDYMHFDLRQQLSSKSDKGKAAQVTGVSRNAWDKEFRVVLTSDSYIRLEHGFYRPRQASSSSAGKHLSHEDMETLFGTDGMTMFVVKNMNEPPGFTKFMQIPYARKLFQSISDAINELWKEKTQLMEQVQIRLKAAADKLSPGLKPNYNYTRAFVQILTSKVSSKIADYLGKTSKKRGLVDEQSTGAKRSFVQPLLPFVVRVLEDDNNTFFNNVKMMVEKSGRYKYVMTDAKRDSFKKVLASVFAPLMGVTIEDATSLIDTAWYSSLTHVKLQAMWVLCLETIRFLLDSNRRIDESSFAKALKDRVSNGVQSLSFV